MAKSKSSKRSRDNVRAQREHLLRQGLRLIRIRVPDVRSPAFAAAAHRQSYAVARSRHAVVDQAFTDAISE